MKRITVFLSSAMNGELDEERSNIRLLFKTDPSLQDFYDLYAIEDHGSPREIETAFTNEVQDSDVLLILLHKDLRSPVLKEYETARTNNRKVFAYIKATDSERAPELQDFIRNEIYKYNPGSFTSSHDLCNKIKADFRDDLIVTYQRNISDTIATDKVEFTRSTASSSQSIYRYFPVDELMKAHEIEAIAKLDTDQLVSLSSMMVEESGNYKNSLYLLEFGLLKEPTNWILYNNRGLILDEMGLDNAALFCYQKAIELNPKSDTALYNLGNSYFKIAAFEKALDCYLKSLELVPDKENAISRIASCYLKLGDTKRSLDWTKLAYEKRKDEINLMNLAAAHALNKNEQRALEICEQLKDSKNLYHNVRASILYNAKEYEKTLEEIDYIYHSGALEFNTALIKFYSLVELDLHSEAIQWLQEIEKRFPMNAFDYNNLGFSLMRKHGRSPEATDCFKKALELDSSQMLIWNNLQANYGELGQYEEGLKACDQALEIQPFDPKSIRNKSAFLLRTGKVQETFKFFLSKIYGVVGAEVNEDELDEIISNAYQDAGIADPEALDSLVENLIKLSNTLNT